MRASKFQPPLRRPDMLVRGRLLSSLHDHADRKLQIIIAPAGFGKTTLLCDFAQNTDYPVSWVLLDAADADLSHFIETIIVALGHHATGFGRRTRELLRRSREVERRSAGLAGELAAEIEETLDGVIILALDDYHEVNDSPAVTRFMDELLRVLPDNLRIVLAGRTLPALQVSRLIVQDEVFGLGAEDLRFTADELLSLYRRRPGPEVTPEQVSALAQGAEGWVAGFLLSVPDLWDGLVSGLVASSGEGNILYNYLAAEAYDRQPEAVRRFLLATAVPDTPDPAWCEAALGQGDWADVRDAVERAGLFLTRLPGEHGAFRYHPFFREFLMSRLHREDREEALRLHRVTAGWVRERGAWEEAIPHLRAAGEDAAAAALTEANVSQLEHSGRWRRLAALVESLPESARRPALLRAAARAAMTIGDVPRAEYFALALRDAATKDHDPASEAWAYITLGSVRRLQGKLSEAMSLLHQAIALDPTDLAMVANARRQIGTCLGIQGYFTEAVSELRQALAWYDRVGEEYEAALTEYALGTALAKSADPAGALSRYQSALLRWERLGDSGMQADMLNCLGAVHADRGEYPQARDRLIHGQQRAHESGFPRTEGAILHSLGEIYLSAGEIETARDAFHKGIAIMQDLGDLWTVTLLHDGLAMATEWAGDSRQAEDLANHAILLAQRQESRYLEARCSATLGALHARRGSRRATPILSEALATLESMESLRDAARAHLWLAQSLRTKGQNDTAFAHLRESLQLARDVNSDALFDLPARWCPELFDSAIAAGIEPERLTTIVNRAATMMPPPPRAEPPTLPAISAFAFGPGAVRLDHGPEVEWKWDRARHMFFYLLHNGPRRTDQLLSTVWQDEDSHSTSAVHSAVHMIRKQLHREVLVRRDGSYRINPELVTRYDVREFERLIESATAERPRRQTELLEQAVALYQAPFLRDLDAEWATAERTRLERRYVAALERLVQLHKAAGRQRDSIAAAGRILAIEPFREDIHARVIDAHLRLGDRQAAASHFERVVSMLKSELSISPGPELQQLGRLLARGA